MVQLLFLSSQARSQPPGSYLSVDDVSFDPSIDDVSVGLQRSSRSSLANTSATSAADFSTLSINASQRHLSNSHGYEDDGDDNGVRSISRTSVVSFDRDGQHTPTTLTEFAVVHHSPRGDRAEDAHLLRPLFSTPAPTSSLASPQTPTYPAPPLNASPETTPTASLETPTYPAPPALFSNSFQGGRTEGTGTVRVIQGHSRSRRILNFSLFSSIDRGTPTTLWWIHPSPRPKGGAESRLRTTPCRRIGSGSTCPSATTPCRPRRRRRLRR